MMMNTIVKLNRHVDRLQSASDVHYKWSDSGQYTFFFLVFPVISRIFGTQSIVFGTSIFQ